MADIAVVGATGGTGREVVMQALERGHRVTAFVREPKKLADLADRIQLVQGSLPEDEAALIETLRAKAALISTLGVGNSLKPHALMQRSIPVLVRALQASGVRRLILMSSFGVGATMESVPALARVFIALFLRAIYADKAAGEKLLRSSALDWTVAHPVALTNGPRTGRYRAGEHLDLRGFPRISRADVAGFLLDQIDDARYVRKAVLVSS
jgi:putative NADH-flavin reductase